MAMAQAGKVRQKWTKLSKNAILAGLSIQTPPPKEFQIVKYEN